jgi:hypothetical protein
MFIGHFAVGFGTKRWLPSVSLGMLFFAAQFADILWPNLVLTGIERVELKPGITVVTPLDFVRYPYSHSLLALTIWGLLIGILYTAIRKKSWKTAVVLMVVVISHWILDWAAHRPDMPLTLTGTTRVGLGMWSSRPLTLIVESAMFAVGVFIYSRTTSAKDRKGRIGFLSLALFLYIVYLLNLFGPIPPNVSSVAWTAQAIWLLVIWGWWIDRHRTVRQSAGN